MGLSTVTSTRAHQPAQVAGRIAGAGLIAAGALTAGASLFKATPLHGFRGGALGGLLAVGGAAALLVTQRQQPQQVALPATSASPALPATSGSPASPPTTTAKEPQHGTIASSYNQLSEDVGIDPRDGSDPESFMRSQRTRGPGWLAADMGFSLPLPDGREAWFYGDTVTGTADAKEQVSSMTGFLRNTVVVQDGTKVTTLTNKGSDGMVHGTLQSKSEPSTWSWPGSPIIDGNEIRLITGQLKKTDADTPGWNFASTGYSLVTMNANDLSVKSVEPFAGASTDISWGSGMAVDGDYDLIVGGKHKFMNIDQFLARVPRHGTNTAAKMEVWNGKTWVADVKQAAPIVEQVGGQLIRTKTGWAMIGQEGVFSPTIVARTAAKPTGPWSEPRKLGTVPHAAEGEIFYTPIPHPEFDKNGKMLISMSVNQSDGKLPSDLRKYRPRFISVDASKLEA